mgnify:CR=1 FL=1
MSKNYNELIEENREQVLVWAQEGKSYFWIAMQLGIPERSSPMVSTWFRKQGIRRKPKVESPYNNHA